MFSSLCLSFTLMRRDRSARRQRGETSCRLFPPPRVDITSKTWPSSADMLLRRWREGEHLGRALFCAPCVTSRLVWRKRRLCFSPRWWIHSCKAVMRFAWNFWSLTLFIHFDLADSGVGVPPWRLLLSETTACILYAGTALKHEGRLVCFRCRGKKSQAWLLFRI